MTNKIFLSSKRVLISGKLQPAGIVAEDGIIRKILPFDDFPKSIPVKDYGNHVIMPGLIDAHLHINEPGRTEWEGFESATRAAAAGGITAVADMPLNSYPATITHNALLEKRHAAAGKSYVDYTCYGGLVPGNEQEIESLLNAGVRGIKTFLSHSGIDDFPNSTEKELRAVMPLLAKHKIPLLVHAELPDTNAPQSTDADSYQQYLQSRPQYWEVNAIRLMINLCRETGCPVHIVHLSAAEALPLIRNAKDEGLPITVETAPHYLFFESENTPDSDPRFKCAPPIRDSKNKKALWNALKNGVIDFVATDHSPCPPGMKSRNLQSAWGGISSLQLLLPIIWTAGRSERITIPELSRWTSTEPARFLGLEKSRGEILPGKEASFVIWSPEENFAVDGSSLYHRHKITPYEGKVLHGKVKATWLRGRIIYSEKEFFDKPLGKEL
ncbi:allantoinase AllB [soil metagenome]